MWEKYLEKGIRTSYIALIMTSLPE